MSDNILREFIRAIVREEIQNFQKGPRLESIAQFCKDKGISRTTVWRDIKSGKTKVIKIRGRIFIDINQYKPE